MFVMRAIQDNNILYLKYIVNLIHMCKQLCIIIYIINIFTRGMETKNDKFKRLANVRVNNTLKNLELIGNLANSNNYDYSSDEVKKIFNTLNNKLKDIHHKFLIKESNKFNL